jgi:phosphatidylethanolamine-binding protein (PEBP) family uncharacterized protein
MLEKLPEALGHILQGQRSGMENILFRQLLRDREVARIRMHSSAFDQMAAIPTVFTADGPGTSPPLEWHGAPHEAARVVLIVEDADSPTPHPLVHAILVSGGGDGSVGWGAMSSDNGREKAELGLNSYLQERWLPPDPPPGHGAHRYAFQVFALSEGKAFSHPLGRQELWDAVRERAIAAGCLVGIYERLPRQRVDETDEIDTDEALDAAAPAPVTVGA